MSPFARLGSALLVVALLVTPTPAQQDRARGDARGGIEGEPIPMDSTDPRHRNFLENVKQKIQAEWGYPCKKNAKTLECEYLNAELLVEFGVLASGHLQFVEVTRSSGIAMYDAYAVSAIRLASPYPPVPDVMMEQMKPGSTGVAIRAHFTYKAEKH